MSPWQHFYDFWVSRQTVPGNILGDVLIAVGGILVARYKVAPWLHRRHCERLEQSERQHRELLDQHERHQAELRALHERHHAELMDRFAAGRVPANPSADAEPDHRDEPTRL